MKKINSVHIAPLWIGLSLLLGLVFPLLFYLLFGVFLYQLIIVGAIGLISFGIIFAIEMHQDNGRVPHYKKNISSTIPFDSTKQVPILKCSICTGEQIACFRDIATGHIIEVMIIRNVEDLSFLKKQYGIESFLVEY